MKIRWWEAFKKGIEAKGYADGYHAHDVFITPIRKAEIQENYRAGHIDGFKAGRDFEFKTINDHMSGMFSGKMTKNVEWVVQRFREQQETEKVLKGPDIDMPPRFIEAIRSGTNFDG